MTQLQLPGLNSPLTWALNNPAFLGGILAWETQAACSCKPHTIAVVLLDRYSQPSELGGVVIFDDNVLRPNYAPFNPSYLYDATA